MTWVYIWLGVVVASLVLEFITLDLVCVWISIGSFIAMILALCGVMYEIQIVVAVVVSLACILGLRKVTLKLLNRNQIKTNIDSFIGEKVKMLSEANSDKIGSAKHNGIVWSVKPINNQTLLEGDYVKIVNVEGNKLIVEKIKKSETSDKSKHNKQTENRKVSNKNTNNKKSNKNEKGDK